jgi:hypothetical protein
MVMRRQLTVLKLITEEKSIFLSRKIGFFLTLRSIVHPFIYLQKGYFTRREE